jgi:hypothetical protein
MNYKAYISAASLAALLHSNMYAVSMVYNFRIAQITKQPILEGHERKHMIVSLIFDQFRKKYDGPWQNFVGGLGSFIYKPHPYYFRADFAVSHIKQVVSGVTTFSGTETDDILFTLGRNIIVDDITRITFSGLFGFPTHRIHTLQHVDFGYAQVGTGAQFDGSTDINHINAFLYGLRYIHFFPRSALDDLDEKHRFTIGNIADIFLAHKSTWGMQGFEFGYTARIRFGAHIHPNLDDTVKKTNYTRSNFYAVYKYKFLINNISHRLLFDISYGFDHSPKLYGNRYIVTLWASWNIGF